MKKLRLLLLFFIFSCVAQPLFAQDEPFGDAIARIAESAAGQPPTGENSESAQKQIDDVKTTEPNVVTMMSVIALTALLPYIIILLTSFLKIVIVLSLLRNALGVQQAPPNQALVGVALLMSIYVMFPTCVAMYDAGKEYITKEAPKDLFSASSAVYIYNVVDKTKEPLKHFLSKNMAVAHQRSFYQLAYRSMPKSFQKDLKMDDFIVLAPAYIVSQLKGAFEIGVLIYLPFFVIDLVTSNILLAMGMMMLSPLTIALPLKLLLVVMTDGWTLVIQGLVQTYKH
ncbi:MAG: type III secretion system export apparatus subunit SctR [Chlamydiia bacterium]|nr:type III secretion system export apparatus subunit SctR [Chlamydiia bacterium]